MISNRDPSNGNEELIDANEIGMDFWHTLKQNLSHDGQKTSELGIKFTTFSRNLITDNECL